MDNRSMLRILGAVGMGELGAWTPIIILMLVAVLAESAEPGWMEAVGILYGCAFLPLLLLGAGFGLAGAAIANRSGKPERAFLYAFVGGLLTNGILAAGIAFVILRSASQGY